MGGTDADVIVVGAGPAGTATAITCAQAGLDVLILEKSPTWPRRKACGDALTPRAIRALDKLGVAPSRVWYRVEGVTNYGLGDSGNVFRWPAGVDDLPTISYQAPRSLVDAAIAGTATRLGARMITGATVRTIEWDARGRARGVALADGRRMAAPVVVDAAGVSSRLGTQVGLPRRPGWPMGVAMRGYVRLAPGRGPDPNLLHSRLALRGADGTHLPGYGWIFPLGGDLWNVGVGQLSTSPTFRTTDYRHLLGLFVGSMPASWGVTWVGEPRVPDHGSTAPLVADDVDRPRVAGAALPMGFDRVAAYRRGVLLTGDAAGLGNPFNGEGVGYALESGILAGEAIAEAAAAPGGWGAPASERALQGYHHALAAQVRGYFRVGRAFSHLIAHEAVMRAGMRWLLPHPVPMQPINRLMANLLAERGGGPTDWAVRSLRRIAVAV